MSEFDHRQFAAPELPGLDPAPFIEFHPRRFTPVDGARGTSAAAPGFDPPGAAAALPGSGEGGSIHLVLRKRLDQVARGYTPLKDAQLPIGVLANEAAGYLTDARDWLHRGKHQDPGRGRYEGKLVNAAALILAELDRLHAKRAGL
jgi:hypothetical protein